MSIYRKRASFQTLITEPARVARCDNLCQGDVSGNYASMFLDNECDDDGLRAIDASVVHAGRPLDIDDSMLRIRTESDHSR